MSGASFWKPKKGLDWLAALFLFFLLREWLLPLPSLSDTGSISCFLYLVAGIILVDMIFRSHWMGLLMKGILAIVIFHAAFVEISFFNPEWISETWRAVSEDFTKIFNQDWANMSIISRNLLFSGMILVLVTLLDFLVLEQRQGLWFVFITISYLAVLDTFMPFNSSGAIMRTLLIGFMLITTLHLSSIQKGFTYRGTQSAIWKTLVVPLMIISLAIGVGYASPKAEPNWPDPIGFLQGKSGTGKSDVIRRVGYDTNDKMLGGPFQQDDTKVFTVTTNDKYYLRGDAKDVYTGKGWIKSDKQLESIVYPKNYIWNDTLFSGLETKKVMAVVQAEGEQLPAIFYPGQLKGIEEVNPENVTLTYDTISQGILTFNGAMQKDSNSRSFVERDDSTLIPTPVQQYMDHYQLQAEIPVISEKKIIAAGTNYPREIEERYLQLPNSLPGRIKKLAEKITETSNNPYDKARAIENYLREGRYRYETKDVPIPKEGQDFVDQFLFDTMRGYCDHFSTSMVVMLRSIDIPARWVKGFAPGQEIGRDANNNITIEVRNRDAHSWVEVYFPGSGWIPFEATASFTSPLQVNYDRLSNESSQINIPASTEEKEVNKPKQMDRLEEADKPVVKTSAGFSWVWLGLIGILLAVGGWILWKKRQEMYLWWLQRKMTQYAQDDFPRRFTLVLTIFEKMVSPRHSGETLREYVNRLQISGDKRQDLLYLTTIYEKMLYGLKEMEGKTRSLWQQTIERLIRQMKP
ncbi:transglutaminaseTgpA domain-containing protein [Brevibacillus laterosporus]|uniref:transglutaminase TgpA family protein n=1 Tax=Brevibacillus laterosporus TaxID=1465 RepID=UPI00112C945A|nr:transglutaminaseTgpA domain-containing protein [Brevibacillus laterosporus]MBG9801639.1 membrane protein [Brevibacillus laterosporus]MED4765449.1 transglutaminaseTgpA domain-containing protein [Brevibacillus laterosporus]TPH08367.1 LPXTG cell wall anchor domain-containing protein [Brevibacillus laterosporus]